MEGISIQKKFIKRRNKKLGTVTESTSIKKFPMNHLRSNSENAKKKVISRNLMYQVEAFNLITKGPSINKLFFKNDNISLKSESVPKRNKKLVKKYKSINIDKGKIDLYNNLKLKVINDSNVKFSNNTVNTFNIDAIEKSHELKGSTKDFIQNDNSPKDNYIKKIKKPNYISKNYISNDKLITYNNNMMKINPIIEFYKPMKENEIKKKIQKFQSVHQEKKISKFSDFKVVKKLKQEDLDDSLDNINPDEYRQGKTNIELISNDSYQENEKSSSLSSNDDAPEDESKSKKPKNNTKNKIKNSSSINSQNIQKQIEENSNKNMYFLNNNNNEAEENYFRNDITFFRSPKIYSNHTSNKSLKSDMKGDYFNNYMLNISDYSNLNVDNFNQNYSHENMINKSMIKKIGSFNSNTDFDKDYEEENEKLNKSNIYIEYANKFVNNLIVNDSFNNLKINEYNNNNNNSNNEIFNANNYNNEAYNNLDNGKIYNNEINNNLIETPYTNSNYIQNNNIGNNYQINNNKNINFIDNFNKGNLNYSLPLNNLSGNSGQNFINIQNLNNFNNNNFFLNSNQINTNNDQYNNIMSQYLSNTEPSKYNMNKNNLIDYQTIIRNNINQNLLNTISNKNNQINENNLNRTNPQIYLMNKNNNIEYLNNINDNRFLMDNQNYIPSNNNIINKLNNNLYNSNNIYNFNQQNDNILNNNSNVNYTNYNNLNNNNRYINNSYQQNINFNNKNNKKRQKTENYYQNNNNNTNMNIPNNINYIMNNQTYNYINFDSNMTAIYRNINNLNNNNYNIIPNNINYYQNLNNSIIYNNNPNINNYQIINGNTYLNNTKNNVIFNNQNKQGNSNKQRRQNLNLLSNEELAKQAYILAKNQNGCRYLQKRVDNNKELVPTLFFPNILGHFQELSNDQFGNYYIKIIIKYLPDDMINKLISLMNPYFGNIGTNQFGTKVIQYLIELLNDKNLIFFIEKIVPHIVTLINDLNGIHIVQKLICIKSEYIQSIYNTIFKNIELISITRDGSNFIIKKLFDLLDEKNIIMLLNSINQKLNGIITDQYGNYIVQNIIERYNLSLKYQIIENIIKNLVNLSNQKFSSNVVEKCFETEMKDKIIDEILKGNNFELMILNEYGNYVIQKALLFADKNKQEIILKSFVPLVNKLQKKQFGQKLLQKLFIHYPKLSIYILNC